MQEYVNRLAAGVKVSVLPGHLLRWLQRYLTACDWKIVVFTENPEGIATDRCLRARPS